MATAGELLFLVDCVCNYLTMLVTLFVTMQNQVKPRIHVTMQKLRQNGLYRASAGVSV